MTPSATQARGGRQATWTRDNIITALKRYADLYGPDFTAAAFSPSTAKWRDEEYLADRYFEGDPETGARWPSLNAIKTPFGGSFNAAREAAGLPANKPGPAKGRRKAGAHAPVRDVKHVTRTIHVEKDGGAERERAIRRAERAEAKVERLERELAEAKAKARAKAKPITKTKTKVKVVKERDLDALRAAKAQAKEARTAATRATSARERAEAKAQTTITDLRAQVADLKREKLDALVSMRKALDEAEALKAQAGEVVEVEVVREVEKVVERVIELPAPEQAVVDEALRAAMLAERAEAEAVKRAEKAEKDYMEIARAATGEARKLTAAELAELREGGPSGPAVFAEAVRGVVKAGAGSKYAALTAVASAAIRWRDAL
jgi:hypothetical protein